jgi:hypothetical protein
MPAPLTTIGTVSGLLHDAGEGCDAADYEGAAGDVVLADALIPLGDQTPPCRLGRQILLAARAEAAALVINFVGSDRPQGFYQPGRRQLRKIRAEARELPVLAVGSNRRVGARASNWWRSTDHAHFGAANSLVGIPSSF